MLARGELMEAAEYYHRAGAHERLLGALGRKLTEGKHVAERNEGHIRARYFASVPIELLRSAAPILEIFYIITLYELRRFEDCLRLARAMRTHYEALPAAPESNRLLGELGVVEGYMAFNDIRKMGEAFVRAYGKLKGGSAIVSSSSPISLGSPSLLFLYHTEYGRLDEILEHYARHSYCYDELFNHATDGMGDLLRAELAYERDDFETAERIARGVEETTRRFEQSSGRIAALFLLMEIAIARGDYAGAKAHLDWIEEVVDGSDEVILLCTADHCRAWFAGALSAPEMCPDWLAEGRVDEGYTLSYCVGVEYISCFNALFAAGSYERCAELLPAMRAIFEGYRNSMGVLYTTIYEALLIRATGGGNVRAGEKLRRAWEDAAQDGLVMAFVERSEELLPLVRILLTKGRAHGAFADWLAAIKPRMERHIRMLRRFRRSAGVRRIARPQDVLFRREFEVYELLCRGADRRTICETLDISPNNVKAVVRRLHGKLDRLHGEPED